MPLPLLRPELVRVAAVAALVAGGAVLAVGFATGQDGRTAFGPPLGADFAAFYMAGETVGSGDGHKLYDLDEQRRRMRQLRPDAPTKTTLVYPLAPFLALLFVPLAQLPYAWAFAVWLGLGAACYVLALNRIYARTLRPFVSDRLTVLLAAASFFPFLMECWIGGQTTWIAILVIVAALELDFRGRPFGAGLVLSLLSYKPTLLPLLLLLLVVTGRYRHLLGLAVGGLALAGFSLAIVGWDGARDYQELLRLYAEARAAAPGVFKAWKYTDALSFLRLLFGTSTAWPGVVYVGGVVAAVGWLIRVWCRLRGDSLNSSESSCRLRLHYGWATALAWTPLLLPHFAVYDTAIVVPAAMLAAGAWFRVVPVEKPGFVEQPGFWTWSRFQTVLLLTYVAAWISQPLARWIGFQPYTLGLTALAIAVTQIATSRCQSPANEDSH